MRKFAMLLSLAMAASGPALAEDPPAQGAGGAAQGGAAQGGAAQGATAGAAAGATVPTALIVVGAAVAAVAAIGGNESSSTPTHTAGSH